MIRHSGRHHRSDLPSFVLYLPREEGQGPVEYAWIHVLVAIVVIVLLTPPTDTNSG